MISIYDLEKSKYRLFPASYKGEFCKGAYQKQIRSDEGRLLYFIQVYRFCWPAEHDSAEAYFYLSDDKQIKVEIGTATELAEVEKIFKTIYESLNCIPDPHNQKG